MPRRRNVKERINRNREIISLQIKCYKKVFSLNDEVYGSYPQYYIDIIAVGSIREKQFRRVSLRSLSFF